MRVRGECLEIGGEFYVEDEHGRLLAITPKQMPQVKIDPVVLRSVDVVDAAGANRVAQIHAYEGDFPIADGVQAGGLLSGIIG